KSSLWILMILALPAIFMNMRDKWQIDDKVQFWIICLISIMLMLWFFPTSFKYYYPIRLSSRYWLYILHPLTILTAWQIVKLSEAKDSKNLNLFWIAIVSIFLFSYYRGANSIILKDLFPSFILLTPLFLTILFKLEIHKKKSSRYLLIVTLFMLISILHITKKTPTNFLLEKEAFNEIKKQQSSVVFSDNITVKYHSYWWGYEKTGDIEFFHWEKPFQRTSSSEKNIFVLINYSRIKFFNSQYNIYYPKFAESLPVNWEVVIGGGDKDIELYRIKKIGDLVENY
ncbi:hypothetical protein ACFL1N_17760, partial [Thermodesulfobacteriota bacterium]